MKRFLLHIILLLMTANISYSQVIAEAKYSNDSIRIGDQLLLELTFQCTQTSEDSLIWPEFDNFLTNSVEIIEKSPIEKAVLDSTTHYMLYRQRFILTSFEVGANQLEAIEINYKDSIYLTEPYQLLVSTVAVDTSKGIYDVKPIQEVKYKLGNRINDFFIDNWYWFVIAILIFVIALLIYFFINRKKPEIIIEKPRIPAHITALNVLKALAKSKAWESEDKKAYYSSVTDTVRKYLEERFEIQAMEETTIEIIKDLKYTDILSKDKFFLQEILKQADMVKFAKFKPDNQDGEIVIEKSIEFVERTKMQENAKTKDLKTDG